MRLKLYTVHERAAPAGADPDVVLVREGFSWPAAILGPIWLLVHRVWLGLLVYAGAALLLGAAEELFGLNDAASACMGLGVAMLTGYLGPEALRWTLGRNGYGLSDVVAGESRDSAERKLFTGWPANHRAAFTPAARLTPL
jgi:hypothetical protein